MSTYTKITPELSNNIYFLNDKNIVLDIDENISENAIPSQILFKEKYDELSTYDSNLCTYVSALNERTNTICCNLSGEIDSLSTKLSVELSTEINNRISAVEKLSSDLSGEIDSFSTKLSVELSTEINNRISAVENLSTSLSNTADEKFVLKSGDLMEALSVAGKTELSGDIVVPNHNTKVTIGNAVAPRDGMFVWNGKEDQYAGREIDNGEGNTFSINPSHELCGVFVGEKSLCAYITEDIALTATEIRGEINTVSSLLTGNYALSSDVSAVSKLTNDKGYLVSDDFDFKYDSATKAIWLSAGSKPISVDATNFIKDGMIDTVSVITENRDYPELEITFNTDSGKEKIIVNLQSLIDIYQPNTDGISVENYKIGLDFNTVAKTENLNQLSASFGTISANHENRLTTISGDLDKAEIEITNLTAHTKSLQDYADQLSGASGNYGIIPTITSNIDTLSTKHGSDIEILYNSIRNNATFAGYLRISKDELTADSHSTIAKIFRNNNITNFRLLKNGDIYQVIMEDGFEDNPFDLATRYLDTKDDPSVRISHKDLIAIFKDVSTEDEPEITEDNVHNYIRILPSVRLYEYYDLSVTVSSDYFWLSGGNNNENNHAISGNNYFKDINHFEGISASILSANTLSANNMSADNLSASILSANTLSANNMSADNLSASILSANTLSAITLTANTLSAITLTANTLSANHVSADNLSASILSANTLSAITLTANTLSANNMSADNLSASILSANTLSAITLTANTLSANHVSADNLSASILSANTLSANNMSADNLSASILSANTLSANNMSADNLSASILSANTLSAITLTANTLSANHVSADNLSASILSANTLSAITLTANTLSANNMSADNLSASILSANTLSTNNMSADNFTIDWNNLKHTDGTSLNKLSTDLSNYVLKTVVIEALSSIKTNSQLIDIAAALTALCNALSS